MFCTNCDKEDKTLNLDNAICKECGFDNSYVYGLVSAEDGDKEDDFEDEFQTALACAQRCVVLFGVVSAGHGEDRAEIVDWLKNQDLWRVVSAEEKVLLETASPTEQQKVNATWRVEALYLLLWALQKIPSVSNFIELCDVQKIKSVCSFYLKSTREFLESSELRSEDEIYDVNELIYQAHWEIRDAQINSRPLPDAIIPGLVQERHYAINWLMGYCGQEWDEITTDT